MTKYLNLKRRSGKTTMLINTAYATGYPIITGTTQMRNAVKAQATKMGFNNIDVYCINEWLEITRHTTTVEKVLIDEAESIIDYALKDTLQAEIVAVSANSLGQLGKVQVVLQVELRVCAVLN